MKHLKQAFIVIIMTIFFIFGSKTIVLAKWLSEDSCKIQTLQNGGTETSELRNNDKCQEIVAKETYKLTNLALKAIPALSPREEDWLRNELGSGNNHIEMKDMNSAEGRAKMAAFDREIKAISSVEGLQAKMINVLTAMRNTATFLIDPQNKQTQNNKALLWAIILSNAKKIKGDELNALKQNGIDITYLDELFGSNCTKYNIHSNYGDCMEFNKTNFYMPILLDYFLIPELQKIKK